MDFVDRIFIQISQKAMSSGLFGNESVSVQVMDWR